MEELKIEIFGRVQGVGFRQFVKKEADRLHIRGYVRNIDNGTVLALAQGEKNDLQVFLDSINKGPFLAQVRGVSYIWRKPTGKYNEFLIALDKNFIEDQKSSFVNLGKDLLNIKEIVPRHVAIIPDGNRRWAKEKGLDVWEGHRISASYDNIMKLFESGRELGIKYLTFWAFSTENWKRDKKEVEELFRILKKALRRYKPDFVKKEIRFTHVGRKDRLPDSLLTELESLEEATRKFNDYHVQLCLDYGGRDEIARAVNKMLKSGRTEVTEEDINYYLDSAGIPDPDLVIRTSGEKRTSGFMPYQATYAELYFSEVYFPDFGPEELRKAVQEFGRRKRNFGK